MAAIARKSMTFGEGGTAVAFAALAFLSVIVGARAYTQEYAFHAFLFVIGGVAAVFAILNRYFDRPAEAAPLHRRITKRSLQSFAVMSEIESYPRTSGFHRAGTDDRALTHTMRKAPHTVARPSAHCDRRSQLRRFQV